MLLYFHHLFNTFKQIYYTYFSYTSYIIFIQAFTYVLLRVIILISKEIIPKMPMSSQEMIKLLRKNGFIIVSQNGSHIKLKNYATEKTIIVPYHSKDLKKGLEQAILKQAGLK